MVGFPKVIKTRADLVNTFKMVQRGKLRKEDWLAAVEKLENQNWIDCPIIGKTEDKKGVTLMFCNEVSVNDKVRAGNMTATVTAAENVEIEPMEAETAENKTPTIHTILTLSRAVAAGLEILGVPAAVTFYERLGITQEEVETMKGELG